MTKKTIGILLILLIVMIMGVGAISAAYTNDVLLEEVSDTDIATASVVLKQDNNASLLASEASSDVEKINENDNYDEKSNQKLGSTSSNLNNDVLSASNNDLVKASSNSFYYEKTRTWYEDLDDAIDEACDNGGGKIRIWRGTYGSDSDDVKIKISKGVSITIEPYGPDHTVIFDGSKNDKWFFAIADNNAKVTINNITFRNGGAFQGGAIEIDEGELNLNNCIFEGNKAFQNLAGGYGWGGAIYIDDDKCTLEARNCRFINNNAASGGGAVCVEGEGSEARFYNCYFEGNTAVDGNDVLDKDKGAHTFSYCDFIGQGSIEYEVNYVDKSVTITPDVEGKDEVNYLALYHYGEFYRGESYTASYDISKTFNTLDLGSYTIYMMYSEQKRYIYKNASFRIVANDFILDDTQPFESLSAAVNAIPNGGTGVITVSGGTYTESENFDVIINNNKKVTIMPKDGSLEPVIFSANSYLYQQMLKIYADCHLTMEDITITGQFNNALYFDSGSYGTISNCEFENIVNDAKTMHPINMWNSNVLLNDCTFQSNGNILCSYSTLNIIDCTFTNNSAGYDGGAIGAGTSNLTVNGSKFIDNVASRYGGAIYAAHLKVYDTEFTGNSAETGGAIYIENANSIINITSSVFDSNIADNYRNIYSESITREINFEYNEYDLNLNISKKDGSYGLEYILDGDFDWGSNLNNNYTVLAGVADNETVFGDLLAVEDNKFKINLGVLSGGTHEFFMPGIDYQKDRLDHFFGYHYYSDLYENEFYLNDAAYAKILIDKAKITLNLIVNNVLIPETPVLNIEANWDNNYTIFVGNKYYQVEVVNGKASMQLTGLDLGNHTVVGMRDADENFEMTMNFTTFTISKTYSNFLVLSTNVEYDTLNEAVANSNGEDVIYIKKGIYKNTGIVISNKTLDIIALEGAIFDAQGADANFIIVSENAAVDIWGITFRGLHNRNTNYGAIVNHGYLSLFACNFTDNKITKTSFAENGGAAIFSDGYALEIDDCNFINNEAPLKVGTAAVTSLGHDNVLITDSKFINNSAREGGAVHFKNIIQFEDAITSCDFEKNTAVKGSAIYVGNNSAYISVTLSDFKKNDIKNSLGENAQLEGGVIYVNANNDVVLDISLSNFEDNANSNVDGGVICLDGSSRASIGSCIFNNNSGKRGSVILIKNPYDKKLTLFIDSSAFTNNNAVTGAILTSPRVTAFIDECLFANNTGENRHICSNGFTVVHDSIFEVRDAKLNASSVRYGENAVISGIADIGTNLNTAANLTVAGENVMIDIKNNTFSYKTEILDHGKYYAVLKSIADSNNNKYLMDSITEIFRVNRNPIELNVSVDNITYGETLKVVERLPSNAMGTLGYQLNGKYYTKEEIESLKLDAGKYSLVAFYDYDDFAFSSTVVNFEVYKANPTISVADVEVGYGDTIILNIETNVPSVYAIEIGDYKTAKFINQSGSVEIEKTFEPGSYTIKVTSRARVNYISNSTEATLKVNKNRALFTLMGTDNIANSDESVLLVSTPDNAADTVTQSGMGDLSISDFDDGTYEINAVFEGNDKYYSDNNKKTSLSIMKSAIILNNENLRASSDDNNLGEWGGEGKFLYQYDEDDDYSYFDTLEDAVDEAVLYGAGIITVRGGTYSVYSMDIEGEVELTIRAYADEEVIFDCGGDDYFMLLTYETEVEPMEAPPFFYTYQTEGPTVTLENITVTGGKCTYGGAIDLEAGILTLMNCNFINNQATQGGAIYIGQSDAENDAMVIAVNTTFINNYAEDEGGAIYIASDNLDGQTTSASFYLCTFLENYQGEDDERVRNYFAGGNVEEITSQYCVFNGNGEIYNLTIDKINQTVYVNGTSNDRFDSVVLLYFGQAPLYTFYNNGNPDFSIAFEDVMGGNYTLGVMNDHKFNTYIFDVQFEMIVPNFIISEDEVYENLTDAIDAVAQNGVIYANVNYYYEDNMEIDIRKSFTLKNFRDEGVIFDGSSTQWFFTIAEGCSVVFDGIYFTDGAVKNHASIENYGTLIIKNCTFESFETGAIIYNSGLLNILNSTFSLNSVNNAIVLNDANLFVDTVEFSYNIVNINSAVYNNGVAEIVSSNFTGNYNGGNGGAIYSINSLSIKDAVFTENEGYNGGVVYNEGTLVVLNSTFEDNTANGYGGAIFNENKANIFNSTFTGSSSEIDGGAIYNNNVMAVDNSTLVGNTANGRGGAIYNNKSLELTKSLFGINFADEFANIYNAGNIQFSENIFDFYDVILIIPDGEYGITTTITGTLDPQFNMDLQVVLPGFVNYEPATVTISDGVFEYTTDILPKGVYDVVLNEVLQDNNYNLYYGEAITDRLIIHKANVYINVTVDDIVLRNTDKAAPVLKISANKDGLLRILFNNKFSEVNVVGGQVTLSLDAVGEGNYSVMVIREGDENYNDAVNTTSFTVTEYEGSFIVNSTGGKFDNLSSAIENSESEDIIYVMEGTYSGEVNLAQTISGKKLSIISLGDVVFDGNSTDLSFLTISENSDVTLCDIVITGFNAKNKLGVISNQGNLTVDGCTFTNNNLVEESSRIINTAGNLNIVDSEFYDNTLYGSDIIYGAIINGVANIIVNESTFENNTINHGSIIRGVSMDSVKIISNEFAENILSEESRIIYIFYSTDVFINSVFYNNNQSGIVIYSFGNSKLLVNNSIFIGNTMEYIINSGDNTQCIISECAFTDNAVKNAVLSKDKNLSVLKSIFSANTLSAQGALNIASDMNATVNGSVFTENGVDKYRNIYSISAVNISNTTFDAINVDFTVHDIYYGQNETINGTIDIGTNLNFTVNLDINSNTYSVNVTDGKFTYNAGILNGGDYNVVLNAEDNNSNTYVFDKITKMFTVNRIDPELSVSISNITRDEKLKVNTTLSNMFETVNRTAINNITGEKFNITINKSATVRIVYELNGNVYSKEQLENLTLNPGNYLVTAMYGGDKNYLPATVMVNVVVHKIAPNITVSDVAANYAEDIKVNVSVDVADYYTLFIGNESKTLYVEDNATFIFQNADFKPGSYEILAYVFESDGYKEAYANATLTVNKAYGFFNLSNDLIIYGENATIGVTVPVNAYGNITYVVYDENMKLVYTIKQSCLEELIVPNLNVGKYIVTGTYEGDSYYAADSRINSAVILVLAKSIDLNITASNITYGENATVNVESNVDGKYLVYVGNKQFVVTVVNGAGNISVPDLSAGNHVVNVTVIDTNYSGFNETIFDVDHKPASATVSVEDIVYGDDAIVFVYGEIDGKYIVEIYNQNYTVNVVDGKGNTTISNLTVDEDILTSVTLVDSNYSAYNTTTFNIAPKQISANIIIKNITYGEDVAVIIQSDIAGDYIVTIRDINYTISVKGKYGVKFIPNLGAGEDIIAYVSIVDGNYSAYNTTRFNITPLVASVSISVENITYGNDTVVSVVADVDGDYIVTIRDVNYTVSVNGGNGVVFISDLGVGSQIGVTVKRDDNYSAFNETAFDIVRKETNVFVSVDDIVWNESAVVNVSADIDGMYALYVNNTEYLINVTDGKANRVISGLAAGNYVVQIGIVDGNYSAFNETAFNVVPKAVFLVVSVEDITYGEKARVIIEADADGDYIVTIRDVNYTVSVNGGNGVVFISDLGVGSQIGVTVKRDDNYSAFNETAFDIVRKETNVFVSVDDIVWNESAVVNVSADIDGMYALYVNNTEYLINVTDGKANRVISGLAAGNYVVQIGIVDGNYSAFNETAFNVVPKAVFLVVSVEDITYGEKARVIIEADLDGVYFVYVDNKQFAVTVRDGVGNVSVSNLTVGSYDVNVSIVDSNYGAVNSTSFAVVPKQINVSVTVGDIVYGESAVVIVMSEVDGEYLVYVGDSPHVVNVVGSIGNVTVDGLAAGSHNANVNVVDGNYSGVASTTFEVVKAKTNVDIDFENVTTERPILNFKLPADASGNVSLYVNGILSQIVNLVNGNAIIIVPNLITGYNNITLVYSGDGNYGPVNKSAVINRNATIRASDMTRGYNSGLDYNATLFDGNESPLSNANVTIKVDTNIYTVQTDSNGVLKFNNKLAVGDYAIVILNPETDEYKLANLKIVKRITDNRNATIFFADGSNYKVRIIGDDGDYVGAGEIVKINVGGKTCSVKTDKDGYANLKLSLKVKKYTITVTYKGFTTKNIVTVKSVVKPLKKTVKVKSTAKKLNIKLKLKGKKVLKKKYVYLKFKGKTYKAKTNQKGIATFKVSKSVIQKLNKGKKYKAVFTYKAKANGKTIKNTATCYVQKR